MTDTSREADLTDIGALPDDAVDLGAAALRIALLEYPGLDAARSLGELDRLADVARAGDRNDEEASLLRSLEQVLFVVEGFHGNAATYYDPRNSFLNKVLERRTGIPITLSVVFIEVARRLDLRVEGVGFPGHFLVGYYAKDGVELIDPFNRGARVDDEACRRLLEEATGVAGPVRPEMLAPVGTKHILTRMLRNLKAIYAKAGDLSRAVAVIDRILQVAPTEVGELRDRGMLLYRMGEPNRALKDLERYARQAPEGEGLEATRKVIAAAKRSAAQWN